VGLDWKASASISVFRTRQTIARGGSSIELDGDPRGMGAWPSVITRSTGFCEWQRVMKQAARAGPVEPAAAGVALMRAPHVQTCTTGATSLRVCC